MEDNDELGILQYAVHMAEIENIYPDYPCLQCEKCKKLSKELCKCIDWKNWVKERFRVFRENCLQPDTEREEQQ